MKITKEDLLKYGFIEDKEDVFFPLKKSFENIDHNFGSDEGEQFIAVTTLNNSQEFCFVDTARGSILYLNPKSLNDLKIFEEMVSSIESL